jgi:hypothetical protein
VGRFELDIGSRDDEFAGLVTKNGIQLRLGLFCLVNRTGTVLLAAYSRTFETPCNENLLLSSSTGSGGLTQNVFGAKVRNAYDFDVLFNTPITFPIAWPNSKLDGVTGPLSTTSSTNSGAYVTFGHRNAGALLHAREWRLDFPGHGVGTGSFRVDHDQAYQQTAICATSAASTAHGRL